MRAARVGKANGEQGRAEQGDCGNPKKNPALSFPFLSFLSFFLSLLTSLLLTCLATRRRAEGKLGNVLHTHGGEAF